MIKRETIVAGRLISRRYYWAAEKEPGKKRAKREKPTRKAVMKINRKNAERELTMKLHHNFGAGDIHATLTYAGEEPTIEEAQREMKNFLKRLRRYFKKEGRTLKWIMATEYKNERIHHHMIISRMDTAELQKLWKAGHVYAVHLDDTGDYRNLASYLIKETDKTFRNPKAFMKQRYTCSRTVTAPIRIVEDVIRSEALEDPKLITGYHVLQDSFYRGTNPVTGTVCMQYMLLSNTPEPGFRVWHGNKTARREKYQEQRWGGNLYNPMDYEGEDQIMIDFNWPGYWNY